MRIDQLIVVIVSIFGIIFTYWFFLRKPEKEVSTIGDSIDIKVDGGYQPDIISVPKGKTISLNFYRTDPSSCLEEVVLADFKIRQYLPLNQKTIIEFTPDKTGEFNFSCGMNMFHGKIRVN